MMQRHLWIEGDGAVDVETLLMANADAVHITDMDNPNHT